MRTALAASVGLHLAALGGAWLMLNWPAPPDEIGVESISVEIVMVEDFSSNAPSTAETSATETLVAAGAEPVEPAEAEPVEVAEPDPIETGKPEAEPVQAAAIQPLATAPVEIEAAASLPILTATPTSALPVENLLPNTPQTTATAVIAMAADEIKAVSPVAALAETEALTEPQAETLEPIEEAELPLEPVPKTRTVAQRQEPTYPKAIPKKQPAEEAERPKKETPQKKPAQPAGSGGNSEASSVASAASGSKGSGEAAGNAAVSKYPGLVQQRLRRALRFPKGAGGAAGEVHVQFVVSASGSASDISVVRSSGQAIFDEAAVATVRRAAPLPPIPAAAGKSSWVFVMPLLFQR